MGGKVYWKFLPAGSKAGERIPHPAEGKQLLPSASVSRTGGRGDGGEGGYTYPRLASLGDNWVACAVAALHERRSR